MVSIIRSLRTTYKILEKKGEMRRVDLAEELAILLGLPDRTAYDILTQIRQVDQKSENRIETIKYGGSQEFWRLR